MNQKQRDYLIKRLEVIKNEKLSSIVIGEPDYKPFLSKFKLLPDKKLLEILKRKIGDIADRTSNYRSYDYIKGKRVEGDVTRLSIQESIDIELKDIYADYKDIKESYILHCKDFYSKGTSRGQLIEKKFIEMTDKIVFANDYAEASSLIAEFLKF